MEDSKILPIIGYGSPILRETCLEVENNIEAQLLAKNLIKTMTSIGSAVGLAAPQVNHQLRMFSMKDGINQLIVINPVIIKRRMNVPSNEGCLSIPGVYETVPERSNIIDVEYYDVNFNKVKACFKGFSSIIFQHEYDHLNGVLYTDRLTKEGQEKIADQLANIENKITKTYYDFIVLPKIGEGVTQ